MERDGLGRQDPVGLGREVVDEVYQVRDLMHHGLDPWFALFLAQEIADVIGSVDDDILEKCEAKENLYAMFSSTDPSRSNDTVMEYFDFSDPQNQVFANLPHLTEARMAATLSRKLMPQGAFIQDLQKQGGDSMPGDTIATLLTVISNMGTLRLMMGASHFQDFVDTDHITRTGNISVRKTGILKALQQVQRTAMKILTTP